MSKKQKIFLSIVITLIIGEIASLLAYKSPPIRENLYNPYTGWLPRPYAAGWNPESQEFVKKSNLGWHDKNLNSRFTSDCTINFFGDSMLEGFQFDSKNTFSAILERNLTKTARCPAFRVNNFGLSATGTFQQARIMEIYGQEFPSKTTGVFLFLGNDLANNIYSSNIPYKPGFRVLENRIVIEEANYETSFGKVKYFISRLSDYSNLVRMFYALLEQNIFSKRSGLVQNHESKSLTDMGIMVIQEKFENQMIAMEKSLKNLSSVATNQKTDLTIFFIPTGEEVAKGDNRFVIEIKERLFNFCNNIDLKCIDLLPDLIKLNSTYSESSLHINGIGHLSLKGHLAVASALLKHFMPINSSTETN